MLRLFLKFFDSNEFLEVLSVLIEQENEEISDSTILLILEISNKNEELNVFFTDKKIINKILFFLKSKYEGKIQVIYEILVFFVLSN